MSPAPENESTSPPSSAKMFQSNPNVKTSDRTPLLRQSDRGSTSTLNADYASTNNPKAVDEDGNPVVPGPYNIPGVTHRDFIWMVTGLWSITALASLDGTIVATLITDIGSSFNKSNLSGWLGASYLLSVCCFTPIVGRLCDIVGRRGAMMIAIFFFSVYIYRCTP